MVDTNAVDFVGEGGTGDTEGDDGAVSVWVYAIGVAGRLSGGNSKHGIGNSSGISGQYRIEKWGVTDTYQRGKRLRYHCRAQTKYRCSRPPR